MRVRVSPPAPSTDSQLMSLKPPLKWAGGKRWLLPHIAPIWRRHDKRRLVEPFCGGLGVALGLRPDRALLNDANEHPINFYCWLKKGLVSSIPKENNEELFYRHRERFNALVHAGKTQSKRSEERRGGK